MMDIFKVALIGVWIVFMTTCNYHLVLEVKRLGNHIEYLEEYIQENGLPTPAWRIDE